MWKETHNSFDNFMDQIIEFTEELGIDISDLEIDHAALRFSKIRDVDILKDELDISGRQLSNAVVNGREIFIYKLDSPLKYKQFSINCIELPYPSANHDYPNDGWEHVEFVLEGANPETLEKHFRERFPTLTPDILNRYNYRISTPSVADEQLINTTIALEKYKGLAIKFHCYPIEKVVSAK